MNFIHINACLFFLFLSLTFLLSEKNYAGTPTDQEFLELEKQIEQQETEQQKARQRAAEEVRRKAEEQKLREERAKLEKERLKLEEERKKAEAVRQAEIDRKRKEEEARQLAIEEQKRRKEEATKARVTIVFFRNQSYPFNGDSAIISHNGNEIGKLSSKSYFVYQTPPGEQTIKAVIFGNWVIERTFNFQPSSNNFIMTAIDWTTVDITLETVGLEAIKGLENSGQLDPRQFFSSFDEAMSNSNDLKGSDDTFGFK